MDDEGDDERHAVDDGRRRIIAGGFWSIISLTGAKGPVEGMWKGLKTEAENVIEARYTERDVAATELDHAEWSRARAVHLTRYWSGQRAPAERHAEARMLWSREALSVRFICQQHEPLVVSQRPQTASKTMGLWDRDVCEIFIAPDARRPEHYFEFEAAPTGEWIDLAIEWRPRARRTDWEFHSGMTNGARIGQGFVTMTIRVPWQALGGPPKAGERWRANLFRILGAGETRGYLAWQPTRTKKPNFHVPKAFGWIAFKG